MKVDIRETIQENPKSKDFVSIPREEAIYCLNCDCYSVALRRGRCGVCGSQAIVSAANAFESSAAA